MSEMYKGLVEKYRDWMDHLKWSLCCVEDLTNNGACCVPNQLKRSKTLKQIPQYFDYHW